MEITAPPSSANFRQLIKLLPEQQGNLFKLTALAKLSNEDSKLIQYGLQGRVTSVTTKKTYFDYFSKIKF